MGAFDLYFLSHLIDCFADAGYLAGNVVFVIYALAACHLNGLGSSLKLCQSSILVAGLNSSIYFLDRSLNAGANSLISVGSRASYKDSLLCGFNVSQVLTPPSYLKYLVF